MASLRPLKRYALACILIRSQYAQALDDIAIQFTRLFAKMEYKAQRDLSDYLLRQQKVIDGLISTFKDVLDGYNENNSAKKKLNAIDLVIDGREEILIENCEEHLAFAGNNYLPFMLKYYKTSRSLLLDCLKILDIRSATNDQLTINLLKYLFELRNRKSSYIRPEEFEALIGYKLNSNWMPEKWRKQIVAKGIDGTKDIFYNRRYLELCIMNIVKQELSSTDLYIPHSAEYTDYREELINEQTLFEELPTYAQQLGLPLDKPHEFIKLLKDQLITKSKDVDQRFPDNTHAYIKDGRLSLKKGDKRSPHEDLDKLQKELSLSLIHI